MKEAQFQIGDTAYYASIDSRQVWITCPECLGSGRLRVILGDNSEVSIACVCCERGYEGSPGKIQTYKFMATVARVVIRGVETEMRDDKFHVTYKFNGGYLSEGERLFENPDDAQRRAEELAVEHENEQAERLRHKEKQTKTWAWNVSYWRGEIRRANETIKRCTARLNVAPKNPKAIDALESK